MTKVLVTGATGFVGNHVVKNLLKKGFEVIASSAHAEKAINFSWYSDVTYLPFQFSDVDEGINYYSYFKQPDILIHLAWEGLPNYKDDFHLTRNLPAQLLFLSNMLKNGLRDLTITGTCFEYGMQEGCLKEDMPCHPDNPYASAKDELRKQMTIFCEMYGAHFKWLRLFYMYGKGQSPKSLISQLDKALAEGASSFNMSGGEQVRDFLPVETVAEYIILTATQQQVEGIINCCSGEPVTVKQFVEQYLHSKGKHIQLNLGYYPYADYEPMRFWGDNRKIKSIINA